MRNYNVLVFPCGTEIANEIINSLRNHKYFKVVFASSEEISYCNFRKKHINILPYVTNKDFLSELKKVIKKESIDFIIPGHDDVAYELSQLEHLIPAKIIGQSKEVNEIVRFKNKTYNYFSNILPIGKIYKATPNVNDFPVFVKPKRGQGAQNTYTLETLKDYHSFFEKYNHEDFIVMEKLTGQEFTIDCFSDNANLLYFGPRTRDKMTRGIAVQSSLVKDKDIISELNKYANIISNELKMHGVWFFQMKFDKNNQLKLLEIGPRVPGSMMLNRIRGINFIELALYQALGYKVEVSYNNIEVSMARALIPKYIHSLEFDNLYIDFDDTLLIDERYINSELIKFIFDTKNKNKKVILITKNKKNNLAETLRKFGIASIFDKIIHLKEDELKIDFMEKKSLLVDDSFAERKLAIENGFYAIGNDNIDLFS